MKLTLTTKETLPSQDAIAFEIRRVMYFAVDNELIIFYAKLNADGKPIGQARKIITNVSTINKIINDAASGTDLLTACYNILKKDADGTIE